MAKGTGKDKTVKGPKPANTKGAVIAPEATEKNVIATVKTGALSTDIGPMVISGLSTAYVEEAKANAIIESVKTKRYDLLSAMTMAIVKAGKADDTINLAAAFKDDKKGASLLNDQLGLALGFREVTTVGEGDKAKQKIGYAKTVLKFFPGPKDEKDGPDYNRKATTRSNFLHMLKKCAQAAHGIIVSDLTMTKDKTSGTLRLEGPSLTKQFGAASVLLDEKLTVKDEKGETKLKERPSFTSIARMGAEAEGKVLPTRKQSGVGGPAIDVDIALQSLCNSLTAALSKITTKPNAKSIEALKVAQAAITEKLK